MRADVGGSALDATAIDKSFGPTRVLRAVSLGIAPGEVHALLGENGAGKSTLIKIVAGVVRPDGGTFTVGAFSGPFADPHDAEGTASPPCTKILPSCPACRWPRTSCSARHPETGWVRQVVGLHAARAGDLRSASATASTSNATRPRWARSSAR